MDSCHSGTGLDLPFHCTKGGGSAAGGGWKEATNPLHTAGDVVLFSGCEDDDTSSDATSRYGAPGGALTCALIDSLRETPRSSFGGLLDAMHRKLKQRGFSQRPQLSASQRLNVSLPFWSDRNHPNRNRVLGRTFRRKFPPRPRPIDGLLADDLSDAGYLLAGMLVEGVAESLVGADFLDSNDTIQIAGWLKNTAGDVFGWD